MKLRICLILLLLVLNIADYSLTRNAVQAGQPVEEANPLINSIVSSHGWDAVLLYKVVACLVVAIGLCFVFSRAAWLRIMYSVCFVFTGVLLWMLGLLLYNYLFL